jgi:hypothetical protein
MHYQTDLFTQGLEPLERFLKEMGVKENQPVPKLSVNKNSLPLTLQVVTLNYRDAS